MTVTIPRLPDDVLFSEPGAKLLGRHMDYTPDELLLLAVPACEGIVTVSHSNAPSLIEANAIGVSKASAVADLAATLQIGPESVVAFGDMPNDLGMLSWAGISCAVGNAHADVLEATTHVAGACADDGVAEFLESCTTSATELGCCCPYFEDQRSSAARRSAAGNPSRYSFRTLSATDTAIEMCSRRLAA